MRWPTPSEISKKINIPEGFVLDTVSIHEVDELSKLLGEWYPDISVGMESCHLDSNFFRNHITLKESQEEKSLYAIVLRYQGEITTFLSIERNEQSKTVFGRLGVVSPSFRNKKLANVGIAALAAVGECGGAAMVWGAGTMKHAFSQKGYEAAGFRPVGIMPAYDRDEVEPGKIRHVYETLYAKVLAPSSEMEIPKKENMTESVRRLWEVLFEKKVTVQRN